MTTTLSSPRVSELFFDSLFRDGEDTTNHVRVDAITQNFGFHPERLESHRAEIDAMLDELPDSFKQSGGGGMSFLEACKDKNGHLWTGLHQVMEQLLSLGVGLGLAEIPLPRDFWGALPGGVPYYTIKK